MARTAGEPGPAGAAPAGSAVCLIGLCFPVGGGAVPAVCVAGRSGSALVILGRTEAEVSHVMRNLRCTPGRFRDPVAMARLSAGGDV